VAQLVEALWVQFPMSLEYFIDFQSYYGLGVYSASNRNEYQEYFLGHEGGQCIGQTTLPRSCTNSLEIWEPQPPGTLRTCPGLTGIALLLLLTLHVLVNHKLSYL